jgi:hypothetical protein
VKIGTPSGISEPKSAPGDTPPVTPVAPVSGPGDFAPLTSAALGDSFVAMAAPPGGYLDSAVPMTTFRLRYDSQSDFNRFDRATYFYAPWQELSFHPHPIVSRNGQQIIGVQFADPRANGFDQFPGRLDQQQVAAYFEYAPVKWFSGFVNVPVRFVHTSRLQEDPDTGNELPGGGVKFFPEPGDKGALETFDNNTGGMGDIDFGFKLAFIARPDRYLTFQFRTYVPTGDTEFGLGTGHVSLEPSLLYYQKLGERFTFQAQVGDWIPLGNVPLSGNVLDWGLGVGYDVYRQDNFKITPIVEMVGWNVLGGGESVVQPIPVPVDQLTVLPNSHGVRDATGDTIINLKLGVRTYWGRSSLYLGWGHAVTSERWYRDDARAEYRFDF